MSFTGLNNRKIAEVLDRAYTGDDNRSAPNMDLVEAYNDVLIDSLGESEEITRYEWDVLYYGIWVFSLAKAVKFYDVLTTFRGLGYEAFITEASKYWSLHNEVWLKAEIDTTSRAIDQIANWKRVQRNKANKPLLEYKTQGDERVRTSHAALDGVIKPVDDPFWDIYYPPIDWNCRCYTHSWSKGQITGTYEEVEVSQSFRHNMGKVMKIFNDTHPYFN